MGRKIYLMAQKRAVMCNQTHPPQKTAVVAAVTGAAIRKGGKAGGEGKVDILEGSLFFAVPAKLLVDASCQIPVSLQNDRDNVLAEATAFSFYLTN